VRLVVALTTTILLCLVVPVGASAIVPANGGDAGGSTLTINNGPGDQTEPKVSGDLAVYTDKDFINGSNIHYFDFLTGTDHVVPRSAPFDSDNLSDVGAGRIVFTRTRVSDLKAAAMFYDVASGALQELDPQAPQVPMDRFVTVIGANTVAYQELEVGNGDIYAYDLVSGIATNLSHAFDSDGNPSVSPGGDVVVWERCFGSNCDILQSLRAGGIWGAPTTVAATSSTEGNPDSDGITVVYDSDRPSATAKDIYLRPVAGGTETQLGLAGAQQNPTIANGVIAFETHEGTSWDLSVYVIATNTLFRVTNTPTVDEVLNDMSVLPDGSVRLVWAAADVLGSEHDVYARTFTLPSMAPFTAMVQQPINVDGSSVFRASRGVIPVKFTLAAGGSSTCTLPPATIAVTRLAGAVTGVVNESDYVSPADSGSNFRVDSCQYIYNLNAKALSAGLYRIEILIDGVAVGNATFELR